jgi:hemerythrin
LAAPLRLGRGAESLEDEYRWPENRLLTKTVLDFQGKFQRNEVGLTIEVMDFLKNWLGKHILVVDKRYGPFFNDKGMR